jgi:uncharacterized protein DUF1569
MKTFFDPSAPQELENRIQKLTAESKPSWGKMSAAQMLSHCAAPMRVATGDAELGKHPLRFIGRILKKQILGEKPFGKGAPTSKEYRRTEECDFHKEKESLFEIFHKIATGPSSITCFHHPFFGPMTAEDWGRLIYKHMDHHLNQFGV